MRVRLSEKSQRMAYMYLLCDVHVTGVDAVSEQVLCAALAAAEVTVVEELPANTRGGGGLVERNPREKEEG